eukprot:02581.XXX_79800_80054_1 [CDS] Oithona nana genome sequencing.
MLCFDNRWRAYFPLSLNLRPHSSQVYDFFSNPPYLCTFFICELNLALILDTNEHWSQGNLVCSKCLSSICSLSKPGAYVPKSHS